MYTKNHTEIRCRNLDKTLRKYGMEWMVRVIANTICQKEENGEFSKESVAWSKTINICHGMPVSRF